MLYILYIPFTIIDTACCQGTIVPKRNVLIGTRISVSLRETEVDDVHVARFLLDAHPDR